MGWKLVRHAFAMVFGNLSDALRASVVPFALLAIVMVGFVVTNPEAMAILQALSADPEAAAQLMSRNIGSLFLSGLIVLVVYFIVFAWVAVTWHRFILLEEYPSIIPAFSGRPIFPYIGKSLLVALLVVVISIPISFAFGVGIGIAGSAFPAGLAVLIVSVLGIGMATVLSWFWFRYSVILPGTAVGEPMTIGEGWAATASVSAPLFGAVLILMVINFAVGLLTSTVFGGGGLIGTLAQIVVQWVSLMVGASMLTTLYGHTVEGRDLV